MPTVGDVFPNVERVPLVARRGQPKRGAPSLEAFGIPQSKHLALLYLGNWGLDIELAGPGTVERLGLSSWTAPCRQPVANVRAFDARFWRYADVAASVDAVVSKAGYGTLTECIANSVPLVYLPRYGFREHEALVVGMNQWGGGRRDFGSRLSSPESGGPPSALPSWPAPDSSVFPINGADV